MNKKKKQTRVSAGDSVRLIRMPNDPRPVPAGTKGIVKFVDDCGHIHVRWSNGQGLSLLPGVDEYEVICRFPVSLERLEDDLAAEGAWCAHIYGFENFASMPEYDALKAFLEAYGIETLLEKAESRVAKELEKFRTGRKSFFNDRDVSVLDSEDRAFVAALKTACRQADEILAAREV